MPLKILLIEPYNKNFVRIFGKVYMAKLTLPYIASYIPEDIPVEFIDENTTPIDFNTDADCIFLTALSVSSIRAYEIADKFRQKGKKVVIGGVHASMLPEEAAAHADAVVIGECEPIIDQLISDLRNNTLKPVYQSLEKAGLCQYKPARRELVSNENYRFLYSIETGRGCPYNCDFCSTTSFFGAKQRYRSVEDVVNEIKQHKMKSVFFTDDNITNNSKRAKELFKALIPLKIRWVGQGSINTARDPELLDLMKKSGCFLLLVGFESLDPENIGDNTGKQKVNRVDEYEKDIKAFHRHGIGLIGCFVQGFDNDTEQTFDRTYRFIQKNNIDVVQVSILTPFPGTKLCEKMDNENRVIHKDWERYDVAHVTYIPKKLTSTELRLYYNKLSKKVYSWGNILKRGFKSFFYTRSFKRSFLVYPIVNLVYKKLAMMGRDENIWSYVRHNMIDKFSAKLNDLKDFIAASRKKIAKKFQGIQVPKRWEKLYYKIMHSHYDFLDKLKTTDISDGGNKLRKKVNRFINWLERKRRHVKNSQSAFFINRILVQEKKLLSELLDIINLKHSA